MNGPIDLEVIDTLRQLDKPGERSFLGEMVEIFCEDSPARMAAMREALRTGDAETLTDVAHAMKGSCSNFGAHDLEALCRQLEICGREGELDKAPAMVEAISTEYQRVVAALEQLV